MMQANDVLEYRNIIIEAFWDGTFLSEHLRKSDNAAYDYVLKEVNKFIKKIESMSENINLMFNEFFELLLVNFPKHLISLKNTEENKELVTEAKNRILALKDRMKKMIETEKKKEECRWDIKDY